VKESDPQKEEKERLKLKSRNSSSWKLNATRRIICGSSHVRIRLLPEAFSKRPMIRTQFDLDDSLSAPFYFADAA